MKPTYKTLAAIICITTLTHTTTTSCTDADSELVSFVEDNRLDSTDDLGYSLIGIINKIQTIADRTIILGELRGDLTTLTPDATLDLQAIANFQTDTPNPYNNPRDYYAIIQNCNYYLATADTTLTLRGEKVFQKEYAAIKTYRAWTYLQLALNYGTIPFITQPLLAEKDTDPSLHPSYNIQQIANYFIDDLTPHINTPTPDFGGTNISQDFSSTTGSYLTSYDTQKFYYPTRVLIADLCLWAGRYREAAQHYHDYLTRENDQHPISGSVYTNANSHTIQWANYEFNNINDAYTPYSTTTEILTYIPMMLTQYDGTTSTLQDIFTSTDRNRYYYQATHSQAYDELSQSQHYTHVHTDPTTMLPDTITPDYDALNITPALRGDLRQSSTYTLSNITTPSTDHSPYYQRCYKHTYANIVNILRLRHIYLRYAEALNRAGLPQSAFAILKHGLNTQTLNPEKNYISTDEQQRAGNLIQFSEYYFTRENTIGIHSFGSGRADADTTYTIPQLPTHQDTILYVENKISDEMALETAAEGQRYYDLMRISLHRNDPTYLAQKIATRNGKTNFNQTLYNKLSDTKNWYLPLE